MQDTVRFLARGVELETLEQTTSALECDSEPCLGDNVQMPSDSVDMSSWMTAWAWKSLSAATCISPAPCSTRQQREPAKMSGEEAATRLPSGSQAAECERTTVMFRNIPNNYTQDAILELLDLQGFAACYDFFYMPMDPHRNAGLGYAFINLISEEEAFRFKSHFNGFTEWQSQSQKVGEIVWSEPLQGLAAHIERYRNSPIMRASMPQSHKPLLLVDGRRIPFPAPTRRSRMPRRKRSVG